MVPLLLALCYISPERVSSHVGAESWQVCESTTAAALEAEARYDWPPETDQWRRRRHQRRNSAAGEMRWFLVAGRRPVVARSFSGRDDPQAAWPNLIVSLALSCVVAVVDVVFGLLTVNHNSIVVNRGKFIALKSSRLVSSHLVGRLWQRADRRMKISTQLLPLTRSGVCIRSFAPLNSLSAWPAGTCNVDLMAAALEASSGLFGPRTTLASSWTIMMDAAAAAAPAPAILEQPAALCGSSSNQPPEESSGRTKERNSPFYIIKLNRMMKKRPDCARSAARSL